MREGDFLDGDEVGLESAQRGDERASTQARSKRSITFSPQPPLRNGTTVDSPLTPRHSFSFVEVDIDGYRKFVLTGGDFRVPHFSTCLRQGGLGAGLMVRRRVRVPMDWLKTPVDSR